MKKLNNKLDVMTQPLMSLALWLPRIALGVAFFFHGYGKLPAPFMMVEQHRMVTWFESEFLPMPELLVNMVILGEMAAGIGIILGGVVGIFSVNWRLSDGNLRFRGCHRIQNRRFSFKCPRWSKCYKSR